MTDSDLAAASYPQVTVNDATSRRTANADPPPALFTIRLDRALTRRVSVDYATANATAIAGRDYTAQSGRVTFLAGQTAINVSVPVLRNAAATGNSTFRLVLSNPASAVIGRSTGSGIIIDANAATLPFSVSPARVSATKILCRSASRCPGILASWTAPGAGTVRVQITAKVPAGKGKTKTVVLAKRSLSVKKGAGKTRVRRVGSRGRASLLRSARKVTAVDVTVTFTSRLGEQRRATRKVSLIR
jgi:hypothetical protein